MAIAAGNARHFQQIRLETGMCLFLPHDFSDFPNQRNHKYPCAFLSSLFPSASEWTGILHKLQSFSAHSVHHALADLECAPV